MTIPLRRERECFYVSSDGHWQLDGTAGFWQVYGPDGKLVDGLLKKDLLRRFVLEP